MDICGGCGVQRERVRESSSIEWIEDLKLQRRIGCMILDRSRVLV